MWEADLAGGVAPSSARKEGLSRLLVRRSCDALVSILLAGQVESLNVSVAAALLLFEARRQRGRPDGRPEPLPLRRLQPAARRALLRPARTGRHARELRRDPRRPRRRRLRWSRRRRAGRPARRSLAPDADTLLERLAARASREQVLLIPPDATVLATAGRQVANLTSQTFFGDSSRHDGAGSLPAGSATSSTTRLCTKLDRLRRGL